MLPFVGVALRVQEELHISDKKGVGMIMRFAKIYSPEKMGEIMRETKKIYWWESNPVAAFMLSVKAVNTREKVKFEENG